MENVKFPIYFTSAVLLVYTTLSQVYPDPRLIAAIFLLSPFLMLWMVYKVLKDGVPSKRSFDDYFYDDVDIPRIPIKEAAEDPGYFKRDTAA